MYKELKETKNCALNKDYQPRFKNIKVEQNRNSGVLKYSKRNKNTLAGFSRGFGQAKERLT